MHMRMPLLLRSLMHTLIHLVAGRTFAGAHLCRRPRKWPSQRERPATSLPLLHPAPRCLPAPSATNARSRPALLGRAMGVDHPTRRRPWTAWLLLGGAVLTLVLALTLERMGQHTTAHDGEGGGGRCPLGLGSQKEGRREAATLGAAVRVFYDARIFTQAGAAAEEMAFAEALGVDARGRVVATGSLQHVLKSAAPDAERVGKPIPLPSRDGWQRAPQLSSFGRGCRRGAPELTATAGCSDGRQDHHAGVHRRARAPVPGRAGARHARPAPRWCAETPLLF